VSSVALLAVTVLDLTVVTCVTIAGTRTIASARGCLVKLYKNWSPSGHDTKGLNLPEYQDWYVVPVIRTRDSNPQEESNFHVARERLFKFEANHDDVTEASFNHWACGHFDILLVRPNTDAASIANKIEYDLNNYPILDDDDCTRREDEAACEIWKGCYSAKERIEYIRRYREEFEFHDFADLMGCVRGKYFAGYATDLVYR
jgi:hypothetical protein